MNPQSSKRREKYANHLLHFRLAERKPVGNYYHHHRKSSVITTPFKKERFLQANYRFIVSNTGNYSKNIVDPDLLVDWDNIEQVHFSTLTPYSCPICLDNCVASKVAKCGHVFCWPCIVRHFSYNPSKRTGKCPICFSFITLKELKSVVIETIVDHKEGMSIELLLMKRAKDSSISLPRNRWNAKSELFPQAGDLNATFTRLSITNDISHILRREHEELQEAAKEAVSCGDDSLPFILEAQDALLERAEKVQKASLESVEKEDYFPYQNDLSSFSTKPSQVSKIPYHDEQNFFYNYQSKDGQFIFLHPLNMKILVRYYGSYENLPDKVVGEIIQRETFVQTEATRKRYKFLSHIPLSSQFIFVEIQLDLPESAFQPFKQELTKRSERRLQLKEKEKEEEYQEMISKIPKTIDYGEEHFPAPISNFPSSSFSSRMDEQELVDEAIKLSLEESNNNVFEKNEIESTSSLLQQNEEVVIESQKEEISKRPPSFLDVLKAPEKFPVENLPVKKTKKGKQYLVLSTSHYRKSYI